MKINTNTSLQLSALGTFSRTPPPLNLAILQKKRETNRRYYFKYLEQNRAKNRLRVQAAYHLGKWGQKSKWRSEKNKARKQLNAAVKSGKIVKPELCQECSTKTLIHGHHSDYLKPYDVVWLCALCHGKKHRKSPCLI